MNYYDCMRGRGFASRIVLDENGDLSFEKDGPGGTVTVKYGDSITILEAFISEHPDFSFEGARGIIALTGYEGLLGYRALSDPALPDIAEKIRSMGWQFACHSWGHSSRIYNNEFPQGTAGILDMEKWFSGAEKILGKTDIFITPFGADIRNNPQLLEHLKSHGFRYFCSVADRRTVEMDGESFYIQRTHIDGVMMESRQYDFEFYYGDLSGIYDRRRSKPYSPPGPDARSLMRHALVCMRMPTHYCWDGMGEIMSLEFLKDARNRYPEVYGKKDVWETAVQLVNGEIRAFDCSGLIKCYLMGGLTHFSYDPSMDMNSRAMLERAPVKGTADTLPEQPGICLYMPGHVGIYIGGGKVVEATSNPRFGNGVVLTKLSDRPWTHWFQCAGICYDRL